VAIGAVARHHTRAGVRQPGRQLDGPQAPGLQELGGVQRGVDLALAGVDAGDGARRGVRGGDILGQGLQRRHEDERQVAGQREPLRDRQAHAQPREAAGAPAAGHAAQFGRTQSRPAQHLVHQAQHVRRVAIGGGLGGGQQRRAGGAPLHHADARGAGRRLEAEEAHHRGKR